jgi:phage FluMu protein Com
MTAAIAVACPSCNKQLNLGAHLAGKAIKCPGCQQVVKVPGGASPVTAAAPAPATPASIPVRCPSCEKQLNLGAHLAGKAIKCPGCQQVVKVPGGSATPPSPPPAPPAPATIAVSCPACEKQLNLGAQLAGKSIRCPGCKQVVKVPSAATPSEDEEAPRRSGPPMQAPDDPFANTDIPEDYRNAVREELGRNERILWVGRSSEKIVKAKSWIAIPIGAVFIVVGVLISIMGFVLVGGGMAIGMLIGGIFFAAVGTLALFAPKFIHLSLPKRAVYVVTTRHCIVYDPIRSLGARNTVYKYNALQLQSMKKEGSWFDKQGGSLVMGKEIEVMGGGTGGGGRFSRGGAGGMGSTTHEIKIGFIDVADVTEVEKVVREALLDRMSDKMVT